MSQDVRSRLVSKEEMEKGFANCGLDTAFCSHLTKYAGFEAGPRELVLLLTQAMEHSIMIRPFNLTHVIDIVVGEKGKDLGEATKNTFANVARMMVERI